MALWYRFYTETVNNAKVQSLPGSLFKAWVNLLCIAKDNDGVLPSMADIAFHLRCTEAQARAWVTELKDRNFFDEAESGNGLVPHDWDEHQYISDVSTERVKRFRETKKKRPKKPPEKQAGNVSVTPSETEPDTEPDTETAAAAFSGGVEVEISPPKTLAAVRRRFPRADAKMARSITQAARARLPDASDAEISEAVHLAWFPKQNSAACFLRTVPEVIETIRGRDSPSKPVAKAEDAFPEWFPATMGEAADMLLDPNLPVDRRQEILKFWGELLGAAKVHGKRSAK